MPPPRGNRELVIAFLIKQILLECARFSIPYDIPKMAFVQAYEASAISHNLWTSYLSQPNTNTYR
jgi:hypothetical protein